MDHTPGPWHVDRMYSIYPEGRDINQLADVRIVKGIPPQQAQANARLIAAAPELLNTLYLILDCANNEQDWEVVKGESLEAIRKARE